MFIRLSKVLFSLIVLGLLFAPSHIQAQYKKKVIVITGQDAPGIPGAKFSSSYPPNAIGLSDDGKALFLGTLEQGVGGITFENDEGYWIYEADTLRLLFQKGGVIAGFPQVKLLDGELPSVYMSPNGQMAMEARYSADGSFDNSGEGIFIEENGIWVQKLFRDMVFPSGDTLFGLSVLAFNDGRILFSGALAGPTVIGSQDAIIAEYGPEGISLISQSEKPLPGITGGWLFIRTQSQRIITPSGKTIFETQSGRIADNKGIGVVYSWDPVNGHVPLRISGLDSTFFVFGAYHLNTQGNSVNRSWLDFGTTHGLYDNNHNLIVGEGDLAAGAGGATFDVLGNFGLFDNDEIIFQAVTSDGAQGIWGSENTVIRKIALAGDKAPDNPGRPGDYIFWRANNMEINRKGQVAFSDLVVDTLTDSAYVGVWIGAIDKPLELIIESDERVEVLPDSFLTIEDAFIINASIPRTGADGFHTGLNNNGEILLSIRFKEGFSGGASGLLIARPGGLIVNTTTDAPDADTTDGVCDTGNKLPDGRTECSLRAALMEANSTPEEDTIKFSIPGSEIPVIQPTSALPTITQPVMIDGTTQLAGLVEISGASAPARATGTFSAVTDGLKITTDGATLKGLVINRFSGNGVTLQGGSGHAIWKCIIGTNDNDDEGLGNAGHGVFINNSTGSLIGGPDTANSNTIAYNAKSGIFVESGIENQFTRNRIFSNKKLGIDLAPTGVTPNDSGDGDNGANRLQNYPVIDSVDVDVVTTIWGSVNAQAGQSYQIDVYLSDSCDTTGHGEGKQWLESGQVVIVTTGSTNFSIQTATTPERGKYITATATDADGNTSEFSRCVSASFHLLVDDKDKPIAEKKFALFKVANDRPTFTETFIDSVTTDKFGIADLTEYNIPEGDSLKFTRRLDSKVSPKRATTPQTAYSIALDNAQFDSASSQMFYSEASNDMFREDDKVKMTHTTVAYNLYVSVEFDATVAYINNLQTAFRFASNYLYDVTDGQARLDTVYITDDGLGWNIADIWIHASNTEWPRAAVNGLLTNGRWDRFYMPRKFYGNDTDNRNLSANENPLNTATPDSYRTFIHELGHYAFGFFDEYVFPDSAGKCGFVEEYGFMDDHYPGTLFRSEMSYEGTYDWPGCDNTAQFVENGNSCWETFQKTYEKEYGGILAPIIMPDERELPGSQEFLLGPNDDLSSVDVNIGSKIVFPIAPSAPGILPKRYLFILAGDTLAAGDIIIVQQIVSSGRVLVQGSTSDDGHIYFMGASSRYRYLAEGRAFRVAAVGARSADAGGFSWSYGQGDLPDLETESISLSVVQGELPLIPSITLTTSGIEYALRPLNQFLSVPSLITSVDNLVIDSTALALVNGSYRATVSDTSSTEFDFTVYAPDNASNMYFFSSNVAVGKASASGSIARTVGMSSAFSLNLDSTVGAEKKAILTTDYPPIRNGLESFQLQAGKVGVVQIFPATSTLSGFNSLQIRYPEGSAESNGIDANLEPTLRIYHWDEINVKWTLVGGAVDTANNEVFAQITELGTYALFTTDLQTDVNDTETDSVLPRHFDVHQNFPNPFNPTTVISYSLPVKAEVTVSIYNLMGQKVKVFAEGRQSAGKYSVTWNGTDEEGKPVASGVYFYKVTAGEFSSSRKMLLLK